MAAVCGAKPGRGDAKLTDVACAKAIDLDLANRRPLLAILAADQVVSTLEGKTTWNARTVRTLINRLLRKRALKHEKEDRKYRYFPAVSKQQCIKDERRSFVQRIYGGTVTAMLAAFIEDTELTPDDISELKRTLDDKDGA